MKLPAYQTGLKHFVAHRRARMAPFADRADYRRVIIRRYGRSILEQTERRK